MTLQTGYVRVVILVRFRASNMTLQTGYVRVASRFIGASKVTLQTGYMVSVRVASAKSTRFIGVLGRYAPVTAPNPRDFGKVSCF